MTQFYESILSDTEIEQILSYPETIKAKTIIDNKSNGYISFHIPLTNKIKTILQEKMGLNLINIDTIPMRWIKGDTHPHVDTGIDNFKTTHLIYLTDNIGEFSINNSRYPIQKGCGFSFNEGIKHETLNTGIIPRLLMGPISEKGFEVGLASLISEPGGTTVFIKQNSDLQLYYSTTTDTDWYTFFSPTTIKNNYPSKGNLKIEFTTDIRIIYQFVYFVCFSSNIQFGSTSLKADGSRPKFIIETNNYDGLIQNGDENNTGYNNIYIYNLFVDGNNYTINIDGGWLGKKYFGHGSSDNYIVNCSSAGNIDSNAGGILGSNAAINNGNVKLIGCSSSGNIGLWGGGIIGRYAGISKLFCN